MSMYQNALPSFSSSLDLALLESNGRSIADLFLEVSFPPSSSILQWELDRNEQLDIHLWALFFQNKNDYFLKGEKSLHIGFPFIAKEALAFPIFLFNTQLTPPTKTSNWLIHIMPQSVIVNPFAKAYFEQHDIDSALLETQKLNKQKLSDLSLSVSEKLGLELASYHPSIQAYPDEKDSSRALYIWSASLANFSTFFPKQTKRFDKALSLYISNDFEKSLIQTQALWPSQASAIAANQIKSIHLIEGPSGSGKSTLMVDLLIKNLAAGKTSLVIAPSTENLRVLSNKLTEQLPGQDYAFKLMQEETDIPLMLSLIQAQLKNKTPEPDNKTLKEIQHLLQKLHRLETKLQHQHSESRSDVMEGHNRATTTALLLQALNHANREPLEGMLEAGNYEYTATELEGMQKEIKLAQQLLSGKPLLNHPLQNLNKGIFVQQESDEALSFVQVKIEYFSNKLKKLQQDFISIREQYTNFLSEQSGKEYLKLRQLTDHVWELYQDIENRFDQKLVSSAAISRQIWSLVSKEIKELQKAIEQFKEAYNELKIFFEKRLAFDYQLPEKGFPDIETKETLTTFDESLENWRKHLPNRIQDELIRLNSKTVHDAYPTKDDIIKLENAYADFIEDINNSGLYQLPFKSNMLTLSKQQQFAEDIGTQLRNTGFNLKEFEAYHQRQQFWFGISPLSRQTIKALHAINPDNWEATFRSWYLYNGLKMSFDFLIPPLKQTATAYRDKWKQVQSRIPEYIHHIRIRKNQAFNKEIQALKKYLGQEKSTDILQKHQKALSAIKPVWFCTPAMLSHIGQLDEFDAIFIDNATNIPVNPSILEIIHLKEKHKFVFYDDDFQNKDIASLATYIKQQADVFHSSATLTNEGNAVTGMLKPMASKAQLHQVSGYFDSKTGINEQETLQLISLLNYIPVKEGGRFPKASIVCMTTEQRNHIMHLFRQIQEERSHGHEIIGHLERNGMRVYTFEEIAGLEFELLIWMVTYSDFHNEAKVLNQPLEYSSLIQLASSKFKDLHLIHSFIEEEIKAFGKQRHKTGQALLGRILYHLCIENIPPRAMDLSENKIVKTIVPEIRPLLSKSHTIEIINDAFEQFIVHDGANGLSIRIQLIPDGSLSQYTKTNFLWEAEQLSALKKEGIHTYVFWSADWIRNIELSLHQLLLFIQKAMDQATKRKNEA